MRGVPPSFPQEQRRFLEGAVQPKTECREQDAATVTQPDLASMVEGVLTSVQARDETKVYLRLGSRLIELTVTDVTP